MRKNISVIGSGVMGHGIAQVFALAGMKVTLLDIKKELLEGAREKIETNLRLLESNNLINHKQTQKALDMITYTTNVEDIKESNFIIEAVPEILDLKLELYQQLESILSPETIIASNTSTIPLSKLVEHTKYPERFVIAHFINPAVLIPLVEVVKHDSTANYVVEETFKLLKASNKSPVLLKKEIPGFIVNRIQAALLRESLFLVREGVVDFEDIDKIVTEGPGFRWATIGPFEICDLGGIDTWKRVLDNLLPTLDTSESAPEVINNLYHNDFLGTKTGSGIYDYNETTVDDKVKERDIFFMNLIKMREKNN